MNHGNIQFGKPPVIRTVSGPSSVQKHNHEKESKQEYKMLPDETGDWWEWVNGEWKHQRVIGRIGNFSCTNGLSCANGYWVKTVLPESPCP